MATHENKNNRSGAPVFKLGEKITTMIRSEITVTALHLKLHNQEHFWVGEPFVGLPVSQCREEEEEALINRRSLSHTHTHTSVLPSL